MVSIPPQWLQCCPMADTPLPVIDASPRTDWKQCAGWLFVIGALALLPLLRSEPQMRDFATMFISIVLEALPFVMLGSLVGGVIEIFLSREAVSKVFTGRTSSAAFLSALMGLIFPVCECAVIPVTRRLLKKGVPFSVAIAYLLAGPIVNPLVGLSTALAYRWDWRVVLVRLGCGYVIAVVVALVMGRLYPGKSAIIEGQLEGDEHEHCEHEHDHDCSHDHPPTKQPFITRLRSALAHAADDFIYVGQFLIVGAFVAAFFQTAIDRTQFMALAQSPWVAIVLMMVLAVALNLCSEADAFVAASFPIMPLPAQMAFMVLGPMLDIKLVAMYLSFVRKRALVTFIVLICSAVFVMMMLFAMYLQRGGG